MATSLTLYVTTTHTASAAKLRTSVTGSSTNQQATQGPWTKGKWYPLYLGVVLSSSGYTFTAIPAPAGRGGIYLTAGGKWILGGNWTWTVTTSFAHATGGTPVPTLVRFYDKSGTTYTFIGQTLITAGISVKHNSYVTRTLTVNVPPNKFTSGTHLYVDVWFKAPITTATSGATSGCDITVNNTSKAKFVTAGYVTSAPPTPSNTLTTPATGKYLSETTGVTFKATYSTGTYTQWGYALREKTSTATTFKYYNSYTNALQSTEVWNPGTSAVVPGAVLRNGTVYHWSLAPESVAAGKGSFPSTFHFTAAAPPSVTVTAPTGSATEERPTIKWVTSAGSPTSQTYFHAIVYTKTQHTATGFSPGGSPYVWSSGTVAGSTQSVQIGTALQDNTTYYAYVQVKQDPTQASAWAYTTFSTLFAPPATPTVTATASTTGTTGYPIITVSVQCHTNILTATSAAFGAGVGKWTAGSNTTVSKVALPITHSNVTAAMQMKATANGSLTAHTSSGTSGFAVVAGKTYTIMGTAAAHTNARSCTLKVLWYKSAGTLISTVTVATVTSSTSAWTRAKAKKTAPATAKYAALEWSVASVTATTIQYSTADSMNLGTVATYTPGGYVGTAKLEVLRHHATTGTPWYVRNASQLNPLSITDPTQTATIVDYECVPHRTYTYTARVVVSSLNQVSATSSATSATHTSPVKWWVILPTTPSGACAPQPLNWQPSNTEQSAAHPVFGQTTMTVVAATQMLQDFNGTFELFTQSVYKAFQSILTSQKVFFVASSIAPTTDSGYFRNGPQPGGMSSGVGNRTKTTQLLSGSTTTNPHRNVTVNAIAQQRPPV